MVILTLNCGSSSAKYQVYDWDAKDVLASGVVERVTQEGSGITHNAKGKDEFVKLQPCPTHKEAIELIIETVTDKNVGVITDMQVIKAVGHRVLHGGDKFTKSVLVTPEVLETFRSVQDLGPLHNPANIMGIEAAQRCCRMFPTVRLWTRPGTRQCRLLHLCTRFRTNGTKNMRHGATDSTGLRFYIRQSAQAFCWAKNRRTRM